MVMQSYAQTNPCPCTKTEDLSSRFGRGAIVGRDSGVSDRKT